MRRYAIASTLGVFLNWNQIQVSLQAWENVLQPESATPSFSLPQDIRIDLKETVTGEQKKVSKKYLFFQVLHLQRHKAIQ
jgi:hypothetical protein